MNQFLSTDLIKIQNAYSKILNKFNDYTSYKLLEGDDFLLESLTPHNWEALLGSFSHDVSDEKFTPDIEFLYNAYDLLNDKFFRNTLPYPDALFRLKVKSLPKNNCLGYSACRMHFRNREVKATGITLNSAKMLTLHEWLEVVLHEMVHVVDYIQNPSHFLNGKYDAHGDWFLSFGRQFEKDGFHVQRYCEVEVEINTDDKKVQKLINDRVFLKLEGYEHGKNNPNQCVLVLSDKLIDRYIGLLQERADIGYMPGLESVTILQSSNPNIVRLKQLRMNDIYSKVKWYWFSEDFKQKYGPFEEKGKIMINRKNDSITEDKDEMEFDGMNHIDDAYARKIYDQIDGVVDVKKIDDDDYEITIS